MISILCKSLLNHRFCLTCLSHGPPIRHGSVGALTNRKSRTMTVCILRTGELAVPQIYVHIRWYFGSVDCGPAVTMVCSSGVVNPPSSSPCPGHLHAPGLPQCHSAVSHTVTDSHHRLSWGYDTPEFLWYHGSLIFWILNHILAKLSKTRTKDAKSWTKFKHYRTRKF